MLCPVRSEFWEIYPRYALVSSFERRTAHIQLPILRHHRPRPVERDPVGSGSVTVFVMGRDCPVLH